MVFIPIFPYCVGEAEVAAVAVCWAQFFLVEVAVVEVEVAVVEVEAVVVEVEAVVLVVVAFWLV